LDHDHGLSMILTAPSALRWNMPYAAGASASGSRRVANLSTPSGSSSARKGMMSGYPARHIGLTHPELDLFVEQRHHRSGSAMPP
jgi:hypothetical protein